MSAPLTTEQLVALLPEALATLRTIGCTCMHVTPDEKGGFSISISRGHPLLVSRHELASMMPTFSEKTDRRRYVDALVAEGMPYYEVRGSKLFQVEECRAWLEKKKRRAR